MRSLDLDETKRNKTRVDGGKYIECDKSTLGTNDGSAEQGERDTGPEWTRQQKVGEKEAKERRLPGAATRQKGNTKKLSTFIFRNLAHLAAAAALLSFP